MQDQNEGVSYWFFLTNFLKLLFNAVFLGLLLGYFVSRIIRKHENDINLIV
jgi:hypothetical protein